MSDLDLVRDWVGNSPSDEDIEAALHRTGGMPDEAALSILRRRRADLIGAVESWAVDGDYSEKRASARDQLAIFNDLIGRLETVTGDTTSGLPPVTSAPITGPGWRR